MENLNKTQLLFFQEDANTSAAVIQISQFEVPVITYLETNKIPVFQNFCSMWNGHRPGIIRLSLELNV